MKNAFFLILWLIPSLVFAEGEGKPYLSIDKKTFQCSVKTAKGVETSMDLAVELFMNRSGNDQYLTWLMIEDFDAKSGFFNLREELISNLVKGNKSAAFFSNGSFSGKESSDYEYQNEASKGYSAFFKINVPKNMIFNQVPFIHTQEKLDLLPKFNILPEELSLSLNKKRNGTCDSGWTCGQDGFATVYQDYAIKIIPDKETNEKFQIMVEVTNPDEDITWDLQTTDKAILKHYGKNEWTFIKKILDILGPKAKVLKFSGHCSFK